jgi:hypothetical protein
VTSGKKGPQSSLGREGGSERLATGAEFFIGIIAPALLIKMAAVLRQLRKEVTAASRAIIECNPKWQVVAGSPAPPKFMTCAQYATMHVSHAWCLAPRPRRTAFIASL